MSVPQPTATDTRFGSGWISGMLSTVLGLLSLGAVFCLLFPEWLTSPHLREVYPLDLIRGLIQFSIGLAFILGCLSLALRPSKALGAVGVTSSTLATLLGGSEVPIHGPVNSPTYLGLDWFVLDLFLLALVFVPIERLFGRLKEQPILRFGWKTDLAHFFVSHVIVQVLILATMLPATVLFTWAANSGFQTAVRSQPGWLQFLEIVFVADLAEYWIHRAFHAVPALWRFHAVHHSAQQMDWLAGSRLHLLDIIVTRAMAFVPLYLCGFSPAAISAYLVFVSFHAVFVHANFRPRLKWLEPWFGTPLFHHWHHADEPDAVDKNFAIHLPWLDRLFGTLHMPDRWPRAYGISGNPVPEGYARQFVWPFDKSR